MSPRPRGPRSNRDALSRPRWWEPLLFLLIGAAVFSAAFIALSLLIHGSVKW